MTDINSTSNVNEAPASGFSWQTIWMQLVLHWYWFVLSAVVCVALGVVYLLYTPSVYSTSMKILIKDEGTGNMGGAALDMSGLGFVSNSSGFDNEVEILSSCSLAMRTVKKLRLYTTYSEKGRFGNRELYKNAPVIVDLDELSLDMLSVPFSMEVNPLQNGGVTVKSTSESMPYEATLDSLPGVLTTPVGLLSVAPNVGHQWEKTLYVTIWPLQSMGRRYAASLAIAPTSKTTTVARLVLNDSQPQRAIDYLEGLMQSYNDDANEDKNEVAEKTRRFIDERIQYIRNELDTTESSLEGFKKAHGLINLTNDATTALSGMENYQHRQVEMQTQLSIVESLLNYVKDSRNAMQVIPANLGIEDTKLLDMLNKYNELVIQRNRLLRSASETAPAVTELTLTLESMWPAIRQSLTAIYDNIKMQKSAIDNQYSKYVGRISSTPMQERVLNDIIRQQELQSSIYLLLLQKREENAIELASTAAKARIIDQPEFGGKVSPRSQFILLVALALGLGLPAGILFLITMMKYRIEGRSDLESLSKLSILADIPLSKELRGKARAIAVQENRNDLMEEAFRGLRANLRFVMEPMENVLLCTSTIPGEGKTFISANLAASFAFLGKKVLIVGLDIRKPMLAQLFKLDSGNQGLTTYLSEGVDDIVALQRHIFVSQATPNLSILPAGVVPPNPGELIAKESLDRMFGHLREMFDVIVIDTPPVALVSDTLELGRLADVSLVVCRADVTPKANVELINDISSRGQLPKVNLVLNGIDMTKRKYGYYYGYGKYGKYGYGKRYGGYGIYGDYSKRSKTEK